MVAATVPVLLSVLVTAGVVVVAIAALGHSHRAKIGDAIPATSPARSRQKLVQGLAVLRRPQTKADRLAIRRPGQGGSLPGFLGLSTSPTCRGTHRPLLCAVKLDTPLVRTVRVHGTGYQLSIFPTATSRPAPVAQRGEGIVLELHGPGVYAATSGRPMPATVQAFRARGAVVSSYVQSSRRVPNGVNRAAILVPDGIAKVTLSELRLRTQRTGRQLARLPSMSAAVTDNVALFEFNDLTEHKLGFTLNPNGGYGFQSSGHGCTITSMIYTVPATAQMTWQDSGGGNVRETTLRLELYVDADLPSGGTPATGHRCTH